MMEPRSKLFAVLTIALVAFVITSKTDEQLSVEKSLGFVIGQADVRVERPAESVTLNIGISLKDIDQGALKTFKEYVKGIPDLLRQSQMVKIETKQETDANERLVTKVADRYVGLLSIVNDMVTINDELWALAGTETLASTYTNDCVYKGQFMSHTAFEAKVKAEMAVLTHSYTDLDEFVTAVDTIKYKKARPFIRGHIIFWTHGYDLLENDFTKQKEALQDQLRLIKALKGQHLDMSVYEAIPHIKTSDGGKCFASPFISSLRPVGCESYTSSVVCSIKAVGEGSSNLYTKLIPIPFLHKGRIWQLNIPDTLVQSKEPETPKSEVYDLSYCLFDENRYVCPRAFRAYQEYCLGLDPSDTDQIKQYCYFTDKDPNAEAYVIDTDEGLLVSRQSLLPTSLLVKNQKVYDLPALVRPGLEVRVTFDSIVQQLTSPGVQTQDGADLTISPLTEKIKDELFTVSSLLLAWRAVVDWVRTNRIVLVLCGISVSLLSLIWCLCKCFGCHKTICQCCPYNLVCCPRSKRTKTRRSSPKSKGKGSGRTTGRGQAAASMAPAAAAERVPLAQPPTPPVRARANPTRRQRPRIEAQIHAESGLIEGMRPVRI